MKDLMVLGKLLTLAVVLTSVVGCSTTSATKPYLQPGSIADSFNSHITEIQYRLTPEQKRQHTAAVHAALESEYGTVYTWYKDDARGGVKAVHGYPIRNGFCRVVYSRIERKGRAREFTETACHKQLKQGWKFYPNTQG